MNQIMSWFTDKLAPGMQKIFSNPWVGAVASAMQKILPFILVGSVVSIYNVPTGYELCEYLQLRNDVPDCILYGRILRYGGTGSSEIYNNSRTDFPYCISDGPLPDNGYAGEECSDRENRINDYRY